MALANSMTDLTKKMAWRLQMLPLLPHLPEDIAIDKWGDWIKEESMSTFSRFFPQKIRFVVNEQTCTKVKENKKWVYYIKEEYLGNMELLGAGDINWQDTSSDNLSVGQTAGYGYYIPNYGGMDATFDAFMAQQMSADIASLYNNNLYLEFEYPNKLSIERAGGIDVNLSSYVVNLLVKHSNLQTIAPTKMNVFEDLCACDIATRLFGYLKYYDGLDTIYINMDLKLAELEQWANRRTEVIEKLENSYVSASNDAIPYIMTVSG